MRRIFLQCVAVIAALVSGALPALGQRIGANVHTDASLSGHLGPESLTSCSSQLSSGTATATTSVSCTGESGAPFAQISLVGEADAPQVTGGLAQLRASAQINLDTSGPRPQARSVEASAVATFEDLIQFGAVRPDHMQMSFELTGTLGAHNDSFFAASHSFAEVQVRVQDGFVDSVSGSGASNDPFSEGFSSERMTFANGTTTLSSFNEATNAPDFQLTSNGTGGYSLTVGPSFFDNPLNTGLLMDLTLWTNAQVVTDWSISGASIVDAKADFSNTFKMTSLFAFDASGNDITADALAGFASDGLPVPEPGSTAELAAAGLLVSGVARHRRRAA